ncbi:hypothetical protein HPP92_024683 [Vanilla planifolia]|uniref:Uncharacterized protein n=1 Tax=Vanilla planifolia TaxID=51239 RepID=A0A835PHP8_VANPL|nr:hypothetical protein HPP92_024683 [Vanilla planifolia]
MSSLRCSFFISSVTIRKIRTGIKDGREWKGGRRKGKVEEGASEISDRFALSGFNANKVQYMQNRLHNHILFRPQTPSISSAAPRASPPLLVVCRDSFLESLLDHPTGSFIYLLVSRLAMMWFSIHVVTNTSSLKQGDDQVTVSPSSQGSRPPPVSRSPNLQPRPPVGCSSSMALFFSTAMGAGGIGPVSWPLGRTSSSWTAPQAGSTRGADFFNLYFFSMGFSTLFGPHGGCLRTGQRRLGVWASAFPALLCSSPLWSLVLDCPLYIRRKPGGAY